MQLSESVFPIPWGQFKLSVGTDVRVMSDIYFKEHTFFSILADVKEKEGQIWIIYNLFCVIKWVGEHDTSDQYDRLWDRPGI